MTEDGTPVDEEPVELTIEQKRARRRLLAQSAVTLASQAKWEDALRLNGEILQMFPDDPEAHNRIGHALSQLNRVQEAIEAYEKTVEAQPTNVIAQRNLTRLRRIVEAGEISAASAQKLQPAFFIEEVGKTGITNLTELAGQETLVRVSAGDEVKVEEKDGALQASSLDGAYLGKIEGALAERLSRLMAGGNRYQAGVVMAEGNRLRILIREVFQSPEQEGRISFPPKTGADVRGYTRESLLRRTGDEDEEADEEMGDVEPEDADEDEENAAEFGFRETSLASEPGA